MNNKDKLDGYFKTLNLPWMRYNYIEESERAVRGKLSYQDFLSRLVENEVIAKTDRSINNRMSKAGFPGIKRLEEFDFTFQPQIDEKLIRELAGLNFMDEAKNIIFLGPPGVGKTHLAVALGVKACEQRKKVSFVTAEELTVQLSAQQAAGNLQKTVETLLKVDLLIIDELGYLELSKATASLFFKLISARYEAASTIITTNKPFEQWGEIFSDEVIASAILDRLLHHSYPFFIQGKSWRMKNIIEE